MDKIVESYLKLMKEEQERQFKELNQHAAAFRSLQNGYAMRQTLREPMDWSLIK
jgi:hypothetical protein